MKPKYMMFWLRLSLIQKMVESERAEREENVKRDKLILPETMADFDQMVEDEEHRSPILKLFHFSEWSF